MFSLAYVLLPFDDQSPAEAIAASLARFERGRRGDVPDDWLAFHDETAHVEELHQTRFTFTKGEACERKAATLELGRSRHPG